MNLLRLHIQEVPVLIDGMLSTLFYTNAGVPQGSVISPRSSLSISIAQTIHCFADVSKNSTYTKNCIDIVSSINLDLCWIKNWETHSLVIFNAVQTQCCLISRRADTTFQIYHSILTHWNSVVIVYINWDLNSVGITKSGLLQVQKLF